MGLRQSVGSTFAMHGWCMLYTSGSDLEGFLGQKKKLSFLFFLQEHNGVYHILFYLFPFLSLVDFKTGRAYDGGSSGFSSDYS